MAGKKASSIPKINLIPKDPFYESLIGKIMVWAIQVGRYIIVFTEIIVIMSFASRFKLDRDLTDLTARVTQKRAIVDSFGDVESRTRLIQKKIQTAKDIMEDSKAMMYLDKLSARIPAGVQLTQLAYDETQLSFDGRATNSLSFAQLVQALQQETLFRGVSVDKITSGEANDPGITFAIKLSLQEKKPVEQQAQPTVKSDETL